MSSDYQSTQSDVTWLLQSSPRSCHCTTQRRLVRQNCPLHQLSDMKACLYLLCFECFCSILNRLIEQCSRETACQSQLKTQKQKIKKGPWLNSSTDEKESRESPTVTKYLLWNTYILHKHHHSDG